MKLYRICTRGVMIACSPRIRWIVGFERRSGQTKTGICCFSDKHAALRSKSKDCVALNEDNVSE